MSAEGVRELCFINAVMNSHTTVWCNTKTWNKRSYPPLIPCIIGHFFSMTMKIFILPSWKSFSGHVFHSILALLSSCGGISLETSWAKPPIKGQKIQGGRPPGVKQDRCENLSWTYTLSAKKGQSSVLKVLDDIGWNLGCTHFCHSSFEQNLLFLQKILTYILLFSTEHV